jgi:hypothetical protein
VSSLSWLSRARPLLVATSLVAAITACEERIDSGLACPALCPQQSESLKDTTLYAVEYDTSVTGFPATGNESELILVSRPGVFDARGIVRFDSLQTTFTHKATSVDSELVAIDSAFIKLRVSSADTLGPDVTVEVYDVDFDTTGVTADDTTKAVLAPLFSAGRLLGSRTFAAKSLKDSIAVPIDAAVVLNKIRTPSIARLRIGLRVVGPSLLELRVYSTNGGFPPLLFIRPSSDTSVADIVLAAYSKTPADPTTAAEVSDFQLIALAPPAAPANIIRVGGAPARRGYLRFNIPTEILDSSSVVRATLELTQRPNPAAPNASDTAGVRPFELAVSGALTDLRRALVFRGFSLDTAGMAPKDSGARAFEMIGALRRWRFTTAARTPRAIALVATREGISGWQVDFYSRTAPLAVRPRLRVTYIPQPKAGLP